MRKIKGQINIEFLSAAIIYLIALFGLMMAGSNVLPGFTSNVEQASVNLEAHQVSTQVLTQTGYSRASGGTQDWHQNTNTINNIESFGLAESSDEFLKLDRDKLQKIRSYPRDNPEKYFNYSQFKEVTGSENQYRFSFIWAPVVETYRSYHRARIDNLDSGTARYRLEEGNGLVEDAWNNHDAITMSNNGGDGPERGVDGVQDTNAFRFDNSDEDYFISQDTVEIPEEYSIFTWIKASNSNQDDWSYIGGFEDRAALALKGDSTPSSGLIIRDEDDNNWNSIRIDETVLDNKWHHLGATVDRSTGEVKIYLDGTLVYQESISSHWSGESNIIAGSLEESDHHMNGKLDDFRIHDEALSTQEVASIYSESEIPNIAPPDTDHYENSENMVHFGNETLNGREYKFLVTGHDGTYNTTYISDDWDFSSRPPLGVGDSFTLYNDEFQITSIQQEGFNPGSIVTIEQDLKTFGPSVDSDSTVIRMDRYGILENEPVRVEVLAW